MTQIHKRFTAEQIKILLTTYEEGHLTREEIENTLGIGKTRFFALLRQIREKPEDFSIDYQRESKGRLGTDVEEKIRLLTHTLPIVTCPGRVAHQNIATIDVAARVNAHQHIL